MTPHKVRHVQQYSQSECGLCCVAMVLGAWGWRNAEVGLRQRVDTGRDGLSINQIADLLRDVGMETTCYRASVQGLSRLDLPAIIHWEGRHVVVLERIDKHGVVIVDPNTGRRRMGLQEFTEAYSGVAVRAQPTAAFSPRKENRESVWAYLLRAARPGSARPALVVALLSLMLYSLVLGVPFAIERLINGSVPDLPWDGWAFVALAAAIPVATYLFVSITRAWVLARLVATIGESLMTVTFSRLLKLPYRYYATRSQGELMYRLSSLTQVRDTLSSQVTAAILDVGTLLVAMAYIFTRAPVLGTVTLALIGGITLLHLATYRMIWRLTEQEITETATASGIQMEAVSSVVAIKTSGMADRYLAGWQAVYRRAVEYSRRRMLVQGTVSAGVSAFQVFGPFVVLIVGLRLIAGGDLNLGVVVAVQALATTALGTTTSLSATFTQFVRVHAQVQRVGDIVLQAPEDSIFGDESHQIRGSIEMRNVSFSYPGAKTPALADVSFRAEEGQRIAIVGTTGSGKSTLGKVLVGLYPPDSGSIRVDGFPLKQLSEETFREAVAYVPQDITLSNRTIAENIDFSAGEADLSLATEAARAAHILDDIEAMPLGMHTEVREMGANLSGGQRQRIALARALARHPRVLVLDEASSALDAVTEAAITSELNELRCTQVVIAHRLSTVRSADLVIVVQNGRVVQSGRPQELEMVPGYFQELVRLQTTEQRSRSASLV